MNSTVICALLASSSRRPARQHILTNPSLLASTLLVAVLEKPELLKKECKVLVKDQCHNVYLNQGLTM